MSTTCDVDPVPPVPNPTNPELCVFDGPTPETAYLAINQASEATADVPRLALTDREAAIVLSEHAWKTNQHGLVFRQWYSRNAAAFIHETAGSRVLKIDMEPDARCFPINGDRLDLRACNLKRGRPKPGEMPQVAAGSTICEGANLEAYRNARDARYKNERAIRNLFRDGQKASTLSHWQIRELLNALAELPWAFQSLGRVGAARNFLEAQYVNPRIPSDGQLRKILEGKAHYQPGYEAQYRAIREIWPDARTRRVKRLALLRD